MIVLSLIVEPDGDGWEYVIEGPKVAGGGGVASSSSLSGAMCEIVPELLASVGSTAEEVRELVRLLGDGLSRGEFDGIPF